MSPVTRCTEAMADAAPMPQVARPRTRLLRRLGPATGLALLFSITGDVRTDEGDAAIAAVAGPSAPAGALSRDWRRGDLWRPVDSIAARPPLRLGPSLWLPAGSTAELPPDPVRSAALRTWCPDTAGSQRASASSGDVTAAEASASAC